MEAVVGLFYNFFLRPYRVSFADKKSTGHTETRDGQLTVLEECDCV